MSGLLIFALSFPHAVPDPRWRRWARPALWLGAAMAALQLLIGANLFGLPPKAFP